MDNCAEEESQDKPASNLTSGPKRRKIQEQPTEMRNAEDNRILIGEDLMRATDLCLTINRYKAGSRNFFIGDMQGNCSRMSRRLDDRWYQWSKEMMISVDACEKIMRKATAQHTHAKIQELCKSVGGAQWYKPVTFLEAELLNGVKSVEALADSEEGMLTCWGSIKYCGTFYGKVVNSLTALRTNNSQNQINLYEYALHKVRQWDESYQKKRFKKEAKQLYYGS